MLSRQTCANCYKGFARISSWNFWNSSGTAIGKHRSAPSVFDFDYHTIRSSSYVSSIRQFSVLCRRAKVQDRFLTYNRVWDDSIRSFSSRKRKNNTKTSDILANEEMLVQLRKRFPNANGPQDIQVRLVIDEGVDQPATVQVCSLAEAIEVSLDRLTDLIGVALQKEPPVIRAAQLSKLEYHKEQALAKQKSAARSKQKKMFRFRAGIDMHDLDRKIQDMEKFLERGMECEYTVFSKARMLRQNASAGKELVDRIQELLSHCAVQKSTPQINETGNHIRVRLMPKKS